MSTHRLSRCETLPNRTRILKRFSHLGRETIQKTPGKSILGALRPTVGNGEVPHGDKMLHFGADPESYITEYT